MAALQQILSWSAIEQFQKLSKLISSAMKNVDVAVYNYLRTVADGSVKAGISTATLQNGGVGLAPLHEWEEKILAGLKAQIQKAIDGIKDGSIQVDLTQ